MRKRMKIRTSKGNELEASSVLISDDGSEMTITIRDDMDMDEASACFRDLKSIEVDGQMAFGPWYFFSNTHYIEDKQYKIRIERWE